MPPLLEETARARPPSALADLGAGDGSLLYALERAGLLPETVHAVDISPERAADWQGVLPARVNAIVRDATRVTDLPDGCVDAVVASQLIEHVPDDRALTAEIARLLARGGWFYVSSVVRGRHAFWVHRRDGRIVADPTHVREYPSADAFARALEHPGLEVVRLQVVPLRFPVSDLVLRAAALARLVPFGRLPGFYRRRRLERLRRLTVRVPGYWWVDATGVRR